jgi:hypothetical protein
MRGSATSTVATDLATLELDRGILAKSTLQVEQSTPPDTTPQIAVHCIPSSVFLRHCVNAHTDISLHISQMT